MVLKSFRSSIFVAQPCCQENNGEQERLEVPVEAGAMIQLQAGYRKQFVFLSQAEIGRIITTPRGRRANDMPPNKFLSLQ